MVRPMCSRRPLLRISDDVHRRGQVIQSCSKAFAGPSGRVESLTQLFAGPRKDNASVARCLILSRGPRRALSCTFELGEVMP